MSHYYDEDKSVQRLISEWEAFGRIVIAVDFDNTIYDSHNLGIDCEYIKEILSRCRQFGCYIIIWTAREQYEYYQVKDYLKQIDFDYDFINKDIMRPNSTSPKMYYQILLDDRAGLTQSISILEKVIDYKESLRYLNER